MILRVGETGFDLSERSLLVGVLDLCQSARADALARARCLVEEGAGLVEIGVASSRGDLVDGARIEEELLGSFAEEWRSAGIGVPLSARVSRPMGGHVLAKIIGSGIDMIHDGAGILQSEEMLACGSLKAAFALGPSLARGEGVGVADPLDGFSDLKRKAAFAASVGIPAESFCLAPGPELGVYGKLGALLALGHPLLISAMPEGSSVERSQARAVACVVQGFLRGARAFRVRHVRPALAAVRMMEALDGKTSPWRGLDS